MRSSTGSCPWWTTRPRDGGGVPFRKTTKGKYKSPSGKVYTARQVRAYYATAGFKRKPRKKKT